MTANPTKQSLYDAYVSSGQASARPMGMSTEDRFRSNQPYIERMIRLHLSRENKNARIVDLGCGHGGWIYFLKKHGFTNVAGVDISAEQVNLAHQIGINEVVLGDLESFIEQESKVDFVILMDVLEHLTITQSNSLVRRIAERLSPGGRLLIHVPNAEGIFGQRIRYGDLTHELCFTPKSIRQLLVPSGFRDILSFEDRPIVHGIRSAIRRLIWDVGTLYFRVMLAAETGETRVVLSQNMTVIAAVAKEKQR